MALAATKFFDRVLRGPYQALCGTPQAGTHFNGIFRFDDVELEEGNSFDRGRDYDEPGGGPTADGVQRPVLKSRVALAVGQTDEDVTL